MNKISALVAAVVFLFLVQWPAIVRADPESVSTDASAAALIDVTSGRLIYSHNGVERLPIASLTKIMTAIVAIEYGDLSSQVKVSNRAAGKEGSSIYLKSGEKMSLHHMLYGMMLRSGNDAATAIAEHVGGSEAGFVELMNQKAAEIGMVNSQFKNPHGLDAEGHYSSAEDLAVLTAYALQNPTFRAIVKTTVVKVPDPSEPWDRVWFNKNKMLKMYEGADGVKTGYTKRSGRCLVTSASRDGQQLVAVTINDGNDWIDHMRLFDYGFEQYPLQTVISAGEKVRGTNLAATRTFNYPLAEDERKEVRYTTDLFASESLNYRLGERGLMRILIDGVEVGQVLLVDTDSPRLRQGHSDALSQLRETFGGSWLETASWLWQSVITLR